MDALEKPYFMAFTGIDRRANFHMDIPDEQDKRPRFYPVYPCK